MIESVAAGVAEGAVFGQITEQLPDTVGRVVRSLPDPTTPTGILFYGAWVVFGFTTVKSLRGRIRSWRYDSSPTVEQESSTVQSGRVRKIQDAGDRKRNVAVTLPSALPLPEGIRSVTHHEIHAVTLGLVAGVTNAWLLSTGLWTVAVAVAVAFVAGAIRYGYRSTGSSRMEPWYGLLAFGGGTLVGLVLFDPAALRSVLSV